jgi:hypothetical protein
VSEVVVKIFGGLGNQMFQYAYAYAVAKQNGSRLYLDISDFETNQHHQGYELSRFAGVDNTLLGSKDRNKLLGAFFNERLLIRRKLLPVNQRFYIEKTFGWYTIPEAFSRIYLYGYWQSDTFFRQYRNELKEIFRFRTDHEAANKPVLEKIRSSNAVAVHIRRGDFIKNAKNLQYHGVCSPDYYKKAVDIIRKTVDTPVFFIFSDDLEWVKGHLDLGGSEAVYVDVNKGAHSFMDMYLMSECKHAVIANSSFSWWGAWLAGHPEQIVIAPRRWFADRTIQSDIIVPDGWLLI